MGKSKIETGLNFEDDAALFETYVLAVGYMDAKTISQIKHGQVSHKLTATLGVDDGAEDKLNILITKP